MEGLFRTTRPELGECVRVKKVRDVDLYLTRDTYEANRYQPPYDELPTEEEFERLSGGVSFGK